MKTFVRALLAAAVTVLGAALFACGDDSAPPAPAATATSPAAQEPPATPTASPTPSASTIPGLDVPLAELTIAPAKPLQAGWTLFSWQTPCYQCDPSFADFRRWTSDGKTAIGEFLFSFTQPPVTASGDAPGVYTVSFAADGRRIAAGLCTRGNCGGLSEPSEDALAELFRSDDGGRTWRSLGSLERGAYVAGFIGDDVVIRKTTLSGDHWESTFLTPDGRRLDPAGLSPDRMVAAAGRETVWVRYGNDANGQNHLRSNYLDAGGAIAVPLPDTDTFLVGLTGDAGYVWELHPADARGRPSTVLAIADRAGKVSRAFRWDGKWWSIRGITDGRYISGYGDDASLGEPPTPFIVDLDTGILTPLSGLPRSSAETYTHPFSVLPPP